MSLVDILAINGIQRVGDVIAVAAEKNLEVAAACTLLELESFGGLNVWGNDGVSTGGVYVKGSLVTRDSYLAYKLRRATLGAQGVGPCQLTSFGYQDAADNLNGCFDWMSNARIGFGILAGFLGKYSDHGGFLAYNGGSAYADKAMPILTTWRARVHGVTGGNTTLSEGSTGPAVLKLQLWLNLMFPSYSRIDTAPQRYGPQTIAVVKEFQRRTGLQADGVVGPATWAKLLSYGYRQ